MKVKRFTLPRIIAFTVILIWSLSLLYPFVWAFLCSLKSQEEYILDKVSLPQHWLFSNYGRAFTSLAATGKNMFEMLWNSVWYSFGAVLIGCFVSCCSAYVVAKYKFPFKGLLYTVALVTLMIPIVGNLPSLFKVFARLGILDTPFILLFSANGMGFNFIILCACFRGISWEYAEAAYIDGANHFTVFFRVMLPQVAPPLLGLLVTGFIGTWNDYTSPLVFFPSYITLSSGLFVYQTESARALNYPVLFAGVLASALPMLTLFLVFQKSLLTINLGGGLKG